MNILTKLLSKANYPINVTDSSSSSFYNNLLPATKFDYISSAGDIYTNSVVTACINFVYRKLLEASLAFYEKDKETGKWSIIHTPSQVQSDILSMINNPNEDHTMDHIMYGVLVSFACNGKAYILVLRNSVGRPVGLLYLNHKSIIERRVGNELLSYYEVITSKGNLTVPKRDIIPLTYGNSPMGANLGMPIFYPAYKDIAVDNEAATSQGAMFRNKGVPGTIFVPKVTNGAPPTAEQRSQLRRIWDYFTGDKTGGAVALPLPVDVIQMGHTNEQMQINASRNACASRIASVYGLDIMVLGLPSDNKTYSNFQEALDAAIEHSVIPQLTLISKWLTKFLFSEFSVDGSKYKLDFDLSNVRGLQEDIDKMHDRIRKDYEKDMITHGTMCKLLDYPIIPEYQDKLYTEVIASEQVEKATEDS